MKIIVDNLIFEALKPSEFRQYMNVGRDLAMERIGQIWSKLQAESIGSNRNGDRLYFNITEKVDFWDLKEIPISVEINNFLKEKGFEIVDLKNNKAKNLKDGRIISIMKVLEALRKEYYYPVTGYIEDYERQRSLMLDKQDKIMVISKSAYDIAGMSTDRKWGSCMDIRGKHENKKYVPLEIETGTLVSYLINPSDKNINNPYARVLIKPYLNMGDETDVLYGIEHDIVRYGKRDPEYIKSLINLLDKAQGEKIGIFNLNPTSYVDFGEKQKIKTPDFKKMSIEDIKKILKGLNIENYKINDDGTVDVNGSVYIAELGLKKIPMQFNIVTGTFDCSNNKLESLNGVPREVGRSFYCYKNSLESLEGAPREVGGNFYCFNNLLKSLEGAPREVGGDFDCSMNELESLKGAPTKVGGDFDCPKKFTEEDVKAVSDVGGEIFV